MLAACAEATLLTGRDREPENGQGVDAMNSSSSSSEANKAAVRDCFENASRGNFDALHEVVSPRYVLHPEEVRGVEGLAELVQGYRSALADLRVTIEHQFADGDYVATRSTIRGRHEGELMGVAPTGREVAFSSLTISRCRDGRIEEEWELADTIGLMRQVGALPEKARA
jgi:predicted ester cyclase